MVNPPPARILVVDDEPSIVDAVSTALGYEGYDVATAGDGRHALELVERFTPDLLVLDIMMPGLDGVSLTKRLRRDGYDVPVLFLTAKSAPDERIEGLQVGADDYVTKPFTLGEVVARVQAILRRTRGNVPTGPMRFADLVLDEERHEVRRNGELVKLTATEFNLLQYFLENPRRVLSKQQILDAVWHYDFDGDPNIVETYVSYLRKKLETYGPPLIHTIRLVGYVLREEAE
ncbi:MAG: response regulator transcription factor [Acidimicrobiia bacterium]